MAFDDLGRDRAERESTSGAIPCVVTAVYLSDDPRVKVRPQATVPYDTLDGEVITETPLEIDLVPYVFPCSPAFAMFVPPVEGMQGLLVVTQVEVSEVAAGEIKTARRRDARSGYFMPSGRLTGNGFKGSPDWAEMRSASCRVAISADTVHLEAGETSVVVTPDGFDVLVSGVSLIEALHQMSTHIKQLEELIHPGGLDHGGANTRLVDDITAASPPARDEVGV